MSNREFHQLPQSDSRFFYGYIVVSTSFFIHMIAFSLYDSFGVFFNPLLNEFGWTRAMISGASSLSFILMGVLGIVMGGLTDRFGPRIVLTICGFLLGLGYLLMSQVQDRWQLYLLYGVAIGVGMSGIWAPLLSLVGRWFVKRRGLMTGIVIAGGGIGALAGPMVITRLIAAHGWRTSCIMLGSITLLVIVLIAQFLKRDPGDIGQLAYGASEEREPAVASEVPGFSLKEVVHTPQFWLVFFMLFCLGVGIFSILVHIVPHSRELAVPAITAANILACIGGVSIIGNLAMGRAVDKIGPRQVLIIGLILMLAALLWLVPAREVWMLYLFAVVFGFAHGGTATAHAPVVARLFGLNSLGSIFGLATLGFTLGGAAGPVMTGYIFDLTGSYKLAFISCAVIGFIGLVLAAILRPTKRLGGKI